MKPQNISHPEKKIRSLYHIFLIISLLTLFTFRHTSVYASDEIKIPIQMISWLSVGGPGGAGSYHNECVPYEVLRENTFARTTLQKQTLQGRAVHPNHPFFVANFSQPFSLRFGENCMRDWVGGSVDGGYLWSNQSRSIGFISKSSLATIGQIQNAKIFIEDVILPQPFQRSHLTHFDIVVEASNKAPQNDPGIYLNYAGQEIGRVNTGVLLLGRDEHLSYPFYPVFPDPIEIPLDLEVLNATRDEAIYFLFKPSNDHINPLPLAPKAWDDLTQFFGMAIPSQQAFLVLNSISRDLALRSVEVSEDDELPFKITATVSAGFDAEDVKVSFYDGDPDVDYGDGFADQEERENFRRFATVTIPSIVAGTSVTVEADFNQPNPKNLNPGHDDEEGITEANKQFQGRKGIFVKVDPPRENKPNGDFEEIDEDNNKNEEGVEVLDIDIQDPELDFQAIQVVQDERGGIPMVSGKDAMVRAQVRLTNRHGQFVPFMQLHDLPVDLLFGPRVQFSQEGQFNLINAFDFEINETTLVYGQEQYNFISYGYEAEDGSSGPEAYFAIDRTRPEFDEPSLPFEVFNDIKLRGVNALNFLGPDDWRYGFRINSTDNQSLLAEIDGDSEILEAQESNNLRFTEIRFKEIKRPSEYLSTLAHNRWGDVNSYTILVVDYRPIEAIPDPEIWTSRMCDYIYATFPFPEVGGPGALQCRWERIGSFGKQDFKFRRILEATDREDEDGLSEKIEEDLDKYAKTAGLFRIVALVPDAFLGSGIRGLTISSNQVVFVAELTRVVAPAVTAHEIGHTFEFCEEYKTDVDECHHSFLGTDWDADTYGDGYVVKTGWDVNRRTVEGGSRETSPGAKISAKPNDFKNDGQNYKSFMGANVNIRNSWIEPKDPTDNEDIGYQKLLDDLVKGGSDPSIILLSGFLNQDGGVVFNYAIAGEGIPDQEQEGPYRFVFRDQSNNQLSTFEFETQFIDRNGVDHETVYFSYLVPFPEDTASISLEKDGSQLLTLERSVHAPNVTVSSVQTNTDETYTFEVQVNDQDGDLVQVIVQYSHDGLFYWPLIRRLVEEKEVFTFDRGTFPGGDSAVLKVTATDGINTQVVYSEPFRVPSHAPNATITSPPPLAILATNKRITLRGYAYDREDAFLPASGLAWSSDRDGEIGIEEILDTFLSEGFHTITLTATDSEGNTAEDSVFVAVGGTAMSTFMVEKADMHFYHEDDDDSDDDDEDKGGKDGKKGKKEKPDKVHVQGKLMLDAENWNGASIDDDVTVAIFDEDKTVFMETIRLKEKEEGKKWEYKRPRGQKEGIKKMVFQWKFHDEEFEGKFHVHVDADVSELKNPVGIFIGIGDDFGKELIEMKEKKHEWKFSIKTSGDDDEDEEDDEDDDGESDD